MTTATPLASPAPGGVERQVLDIVTRLVAELGGRVGRGTVALDQSLDRDLGIGSLERVELLLRLERTFGVRLPDAVMAEAATPADLVAALATAQPAAVKVAPVPRAPLGVAAAAAPMTAGTLADVLAWRAETEPERVHAFLQEGEEERPITYGLLWLRAQAIASGLQARGVGAGETVALMLRNEQAFLDAFFGVLLAGGVPVPLYPPHRRDRMEEYADRQVRILDNAEARALIVFPEALRVGRLLRSRVRSLRDVLTAAALATGIPEKPTVLPGAGDPALIQYTSGSTGFPKGVVLTHANILANIRAIGKAIAVLPEDVVVSWLPLYHDMGLIGSWLGALYFGTPIVISSPLAFLSSPARWLWTLHAHRGTVSAAPNFAYDLCVRKIADVEIEGLDLSSWRLALDGSEAVSPESIERFTRRFAPYGFRPDAMCPVYGLAEASVALTIPRPGATPRIDAVAREPFERRGEARPASGDDRSPLRFVGCGPPLADHEVRIVDGGGHPVGERTEGRIEFRGPSVTSGYFRNPGATRAAFHSGWMDSGDLGYWAGGELFVTGRRKDMIKKAGRNLYPQEVEEIVGAIPGIDRDCVAAFGVPDPAIGTERLVVVAESHETHAARRAALGAQVMDRVVTVLGIPADTVEIAEAGAVLKTPSGKIRRSATRDAYLAGPTPRATPAAGHGLRLLAMSLCAHLGRAAREAADLLTGAYLCLLLLLTVPALWLLLVLAPTARSADRLVRRWCRLILSLSGCDVRIEGAEHLAPGGPGPVILVANHSSYLDVVVLLAALPLDFRFVAKRELGKTPLIGRVIRRVGHLTVERAAGAQSVADAGRVTAALRQGISVLIFPEGTFVRSPGILPFRLGAFKSAVETGCAVIPITVRGTREILPAGEWLPRAAPLTVAISSPLRPTGSGWPGMVSVRDAARAEIARRSGEGLRGG